MTILLTCPATTRFQNRESIHFDGTYWTMPEEALNKCGIMSSGKGEAVLSETREIKYMISWMQEVLRFEREVIHSHAELGHKEMF